jgi:hypothetical protein
MVAPQSSPERQSREFRCLTLSGVGVPFSFEGIIVRIGRFGLDLDLWLRGWIALQKIFWAGVILCAHAGYQYLIQEFYVSEFPGIQKLFRATIQITLISINTSLLVEAIRLFLPGRFGITLKIDGSDKTTVVN